MCARAQVVRDVVRQHAVKAVCVHHDHVIEALASDRADDALDVGVLPRRSWRRSNLWMFIPSRVVATCAKTESRSCRRYPGASFSGKACCEVAVPSMPLSDVR